MSEKYPRQPWEPPAEPVGEIIHQPELDQEPGDELPLQKETFSTFDRVVAVAILFWMMSLITIGIIILVL